MYGKPKSSELVVIYYYVDCVYRSLLSFNCSFLPSYVKNKLQHQRQCYSFN